MQGLPDEVCSRILFDCGRHTRLVSVRFRALYDQHVSSVNYTTLCRPDLRRFTRLQKLLVGYHLPDLSILARCCPVLRDVHIVGGQLHDAFRFSQALPARVALSGRLSQVDIVEGRVKGLTCFEWPMEDHLDLSAVTHLHLKGRIGDMDLPAVTQLHLQNHERSCLTEELPVIHLRSAQELQTLHLYEVDLVNDAQIAASAPNLKYLHYARSNADLSGFCRMVTRNPSLFLVSLEDTRCGGNVDLVRLFVELEGGPVFDPWELHGWRATRGEDPDRLVVLFERLS